MKIVHAADLHLDSPLRGLARYENAPVDRIRGATRRAFLNLVDLCVEERADLLLLAGDLYDGDQRDYATVLFLTAQLARLRDAGVRTILIRGNHDALLPGTKRLPLPEGAIELDTDGPTTVVDERLGVAVHGQGFAQRAVLDDLAAGYPEPTPGAFNIGLLHTALEGRAGHDAYAPTSVDVLRNKGYDYWALGHVHTREVVCEDPWIVFPGNIQGRHAREIGAKGATVVTVDGGRVTAAEHRVLDVVRWCAITVEAPPSGDAEEVVEHATAALAGEAEVAGPRLLAARVTVTGASAAHAAFVADPDHWIHRLRASAADLGAGSVWLERVELATRLPLDLNALRRRNDPLGRLANRLREMREDRTALAALVGELDDFGKRLPAKARSGPDGLVLDEALIRDALGDVEGTLLARLLTGDGA